MLKRIICLVCCLMLLSAAAQAESAVVLSGDAIVDSGTVYYSGSIDSAEIGVYVMNTDGSGASRIAGEQMQLLSAAEGSLLALSYADEDCSLLVMNAQGETRAVASTYISHAIAVDGRFYWGVASCALDGSDVLALIDDPENAYYYYPLTVQDGWYYYLDWADNADCVLTEGSDMPAGARLCRLNLESREIQQIGSYGSAFLGIENGAVYYTRTGYWMFDEETADYYLAEVNSGLYRTDLTTMETVLLAEFPADDMIALSYQFMADGIIYGVETDYSSDVSPCRIVRLTTDGEQLAPFSLDDQSVMLHTLSDGLLYASVCSIEFSDDDYIQRDLLYAIDPSDGSCALVSTPSSDLFYFTENAPAIGLSDGRIYMVVYDTEACAISLKACQIDGSGWVTLARGISLAQG